MAAAKYRPAFKIVPTDSIDKVPAQQLEAIMDTCKNKKIYQQAVRKAVSDFINYGKLPDEQELQVNGYSGSGCEV